MMFKTHLAFGLLTGLMSLGIFKFQNKFLFLALVCFSAILPDVDKVDSKIGRKIKPVSWVIENLFGHRGLFHSIFPVLALYIGLVYLLKLRLVGLALVIGYLSHLGIDAFTVVGINFLNPVANAKVSGFIKTGGLMEYVVFIAIIIFDIIKIKVMFF